jgi:hypothetical protein
LQIQKKIAKVFFVKLSKPQNLPQKNPCNSPCIPSFSMLNIYYSYECHLKGKVINYSDKPLANKVWQGYNNHHQNVNGAEEVSGTSLRKE